MVIWKRISQCLSWLLATVAAILLVANLYTIGVRYLTGTPQPQIFGWSWAVVISGSMEPEIQVNDLIIVHNTGDYELNDVITFQNGNAAVTHRIVAETVDGYITKGDANNIQDPDPCKAENIIGEVVLVIPWVGTLIKHMQTPLGLLIITAIAFLLMDLPYALDKYKQKRDAHKEADT